jgi:hypothetical protein
MRRQESVSALMNVGGDGKERQARPAADADDRSPVCGITWSAAATVALSQEGARWMDRATTDGRTDEHLLSNTLPFPTPTPGHPAGSTGSDPGDQPRAVGEAGPNRYARRGESRSL